MSAGINSFNIGAFDLVSGNRYGTSGAHYYKKDSVKTATAQSAKFLPIILEQHLKHSLDDYLLFSCIGKGLCGYEALGWTANNEMFGTRTHWMNLRVGDFVTNNPTTTDMLYTQLAARTYANIDLYSKVKNTAAKPFELNGVKEEAPQSPNRPQVYTWDFLSS